MIPTIMTDHLVILKKILSYSSTKGLRLYNHRIHVRKVGIALTYLNLKDPHTTVRKRVTMSLLQTPP